MRHATVFLLISMCAAALGCAADWAGPAASSAKAGLFAEPDAADDAGIVISDSSDAFPRRPLQSVAIAAREAPSGEYDETDEAPPSPSDEAQDGAADPFRVELALPDPAAESMFKLGREEAEIDRFSRRVDEVPLDIRPTEGLMPADLSTMEFSDEAIAAAPGPAAGRLETPISYSPWTICYRPLYFEEIPLERYGDSFGILQPAISGAHFFGSVAAMPYKMVVRPPRSCECSNGFSRCGDCPLPGYGERVWRADAALIETGIIAGIVVALP